MGVGACWAVIGNKIYTMLLDFLEQKGLNSLQIEDTNILFRAVAVDLYSGCEYVLDHGNLGVALHATTAVPRIFAPVEFEDKLLVDGGSLYSNVAAIDFRNGGPDSLNVSFS